MRMQRASKAILILALAVLPFVAGQAGAQFATRSAALQAPSEISVVDEGSNGLVFRQSSNSLRLYTSDKDGPGRSACDGDCLSSWPPVYASPTAAPIGDWSIVTRADGRRQWALKGRPLYTHVHDSPAQATGEAEAGWRLLRYAP